VMAKHRRKLTRGRASNATREALEAADNLRHHVHTAGHEPYEPLAPDDGPCALCQAAAAYDEARARARL